MIANEYIQKQEKEKTKSKRRKIHGLDFRLDQQYISRTLPFILFITAWAIVYIANRHYGEKTLKDISKVRREIPDLKADYFTYNADLSNSSIQSQVIKKVEAFGLKELTAPPKRIKLITDEQR
jgi:hypothetical protein